MKKIIVATGEREKPENYVEALGAVGVPEERVVVLEPSDENLAEARRLGREAAGIVLSGGPDIHPSHFGEEELPGGSLSIQPDRDELEVGLFEGAREAQVPVWGICRGIQVFNAVLGGTLWQDFPSQIGGALPHHLAKPADALIHSVGVEECATEIGEVLAREPAYVNSRHHQAIKDPAEGITVVGRAPDGIIEAVSWTASPWWLHGVQWHPENLVALPQQRELWERFIRAVEAYEDRSRDGEPLPRAAVLAGASR